MRFLNIYVCMDVISREKVAPIHFGAIRKLVMLRPFHDILKSPIN
jgi:hypothetical protein